MMVAGKRGKKILNFLSSRKTKKQNPPTFEFYNSILSPHWPRKAALKKAYFFKVKKCEIRL